MTEQETKTVTPSEILPPDGTPSETLPQKTGLIFQYYDRGKPVLSIENLENLLSFRGIVLRYNVISKSTELLIPGTDFSPENSYIASKAHLMSEMQKAKLPVGHLNDFMIAISDKNKYNPVREWIRSKEWDGKDRIAELCSTIKAKNEEAKNLFIRRWLLTAVAAVDLPEGLDAAGALVLQGPQGLGKTWWIRKLCPMPGIVKTGMWLNPKDRDSLMQAIRYWIVELGELGATFRSTDIEILKAVLTNENDILRRPYGENSQIYPRRTVFAASVNESIYLYDKTGNRRFWTVECTFINSYHQIDMQQLWAEVYDLYCQGESHQLSPHERELVDEINSEHVQIDPVEEDILQMYAWETPFTRVWKTATQIAKEIGIRYPTQKETRVITSFVRKLNNNEPQYEKRNTAGRFLLIPNARN